jgi:hypothetical protein
VLDDTSITVEPSEVVTPVVNSLPPPWVPSDVEENLKG